MCTYSDDQSVCDMSLSPDGSVLATVGEDGHLKFWQINWDKEEPPKYVFQMCTYCKRNSTEAMGDRTCYAHLCIYWIVGDVLDHVKV